MTDRKLAALCASVLLAAACARPTPAPVPVPAPTRARLVERAPVPAVNPALPPVPEVRGPLHISVTYPSPNQLIQSRDSNFIFGTVGNGDAGLKINGALVPVWPNGSFMGWVANPPPQRPVYDIVAVTASDSASLVYPVRVRPPTDTILARDIIRRDTVVPAPPNLFALVGSPALVVNDTDRVFIGRPAPGTGQEYKWFLFPGTPVRVTGTKNDFTRIELDSAAPIWIQSSDIQVQPPGYAPPPRTAAPARVQSAAEWVDLVVPTNTPPPYLVEEGDRSVSVLLYGTMAEHGGDAVLRFPADTYVGAVTVGYEPNRARYTIQLNRAPYGYLAMWRNGSFVFRVRRPPVIADSGNPLKGLTITVDPGHPPGGTKGPSGFSEAEAVLAVGLRLRDLLAAKGVNVVMTRATMDPVELGLRPIISRRANAHAFVSIHLDAEPDGVNPFTHASTAAYYFWPHSLPLAQATFAELAPRMSLPALGPKFGNFAVIRGTWMPSILCEGGLLIMPDVEAALRYPQYQEAYARAILAGLEAYFASLARSQ